MGWGWGSEVRFEFEKSTLAVLGRVDQTLKVGLQCWVIHKEVPADCRRRMTLAQTTVVK